jgi:hypothetical protein
MDALHEMQTVASARATRAAGLMSFGSPCSGFRMNAFSFSRHLAQKFTNGNDSGRRGVPGPLCADARVGRVGPGVDRSSPERMRCQSDVTHSSWMAGRRGLGAWTGSWTGSPDYPSAASAVSAITRAIGAASAPGAPGRASHDPLVVGSNSTRPTCDHPASSATVISADR